MAIVTTRAQQVKIGAAARKVGGYRALVGLAEKRRAVTETAKAVGQTGKIEQDDKTGDWIVVTRVVSHRKLPALKSALLSLEARKSAR
jgi:hypothetical protein